jgi:tol-pal system protein YbgF
MRLRVVVAAAWSVAVAGCNGQVTELRTEIDGLKARLVELDQANAAQRHRTSGLEDSLLLLQDQVDTQRLAVSRVGSLPVLPTTIVTPTREPAPAKPEFQSTAVSIRMPNTAPLPMVRMTPTADDNEAAESGEDDDDDASAPRSARESRDVGNPDDMGDVYASLDDNGRVTTSKVPGKGAGKAAIRSAGIRPVPKDAVRIPDPSEDAAPLAAYRTAYESYQQGRLDDSLAAFRAFTKSYPKHPYSDNAQYWVGECLYDRKEWESARREFMRVVTEHPDGNKVPDAMVKVGLCAQQMQQADEARRMYDSVMLTFPDSPAAAVAMRLLGEMP